MPFKSKKPHSLIVDICMQKSSEVCESSHSVAITEIKKLRCPKTNPNQVRYDGEAPLLSQLNMRYLEAVQALLNSPLVNTNMTNDKAVTSLLIAAKEGQNEIVRVLRRIRRK